MTKPVVQYMKAETTPEKGGYAFIQVLDHPRFQIGTWVWTSLILKVEGEKFETQNTIYIPVFDPDMMVTNKDYEALMS